MKFSFGKNWLSFSQHALSPARIAQARTAFSSLTAGIDHRGRRFLDVGFGQGIPLFLAAEAGAEVFGIDLDPLCGQALQATAKFFPGQAVPRFHIGSILDDQLVETLCSGGGFDIVHSWGVLHHTGDMRKAFTNAAALVRQGGFLIISIYNRHWTSFPWRAMKWLFNHLPPLVQEGAVLAFYPVFRFRAGSLSRHATPGSLRGMDFRHDVRDWLGGYPYEYASIMEVQNWFLNAGFEFVRCRPTIGFTGCNEFVFKKRS